MLQWNWFFNICARKPVTEARKNVLYHVSPESKETQGFHPGGPHIIKVSSMIEDGKYEGGRLSIITSRATLCFNTLEIAKVLKRASRADFPKYRGWVFTMATRYWGSDVRN